MQKIAIIIVHFNDTRFLINLIDKMLKQSPDDIIVVDDNSTEIDIETIKKLIPQVKVIKNDLKKGPFGAFIKGCMATDCEYVSCWSVDDVPNYGYIGRMRYVIRLYPFIKLVSCNAKVVREGETYYRTLMPFDTYISPDYAVKIFKNGFAKQLNLIGSVVKKQYAINAWNNGGHSLKANFDGMYFFYTLFKTGLINLGNYLITFHSYNNGFGSTGRFEDIKEAIKIHRLYYQYDKKVYDRTIESKIWSMKNQYMTQIALWAIRYMPKWARGMFYKWFYKYDWRIEKLC